MKRSSKNFRLFIIGEKSLSNQAKDSKYESYDIYYMPRSYNIFDVLKFSPDVIFDQSSQKYYDCKHL